MYSKVFPGSRGQCLLFVNIVRRVRCDPPQDTVQSDQQTMVEWGQNLVLGLNAKVLTGLPTPLPQTGYEAPARKTQRTRC